MARGSALTRRTFIAATAAGLASAASTGASADPAEVPREKGPLVWRDMDQRALDEAYMPSVFAPNMRQILWRNARNSELVRERIGAPWRLAYGPGPVESLDVYLAKARGAPVNVFFHGGDWRSGAARDHGFAAEMFVRAGANFVVPDFSSVTDAGGNLAAIVDQVRRAVMWLYRNAESFGGDAERIYLSGHGSGAQLAAAMLTTDWLGSFDMPPNLIKGGACASGIFDLKPVRLSKLSESIAFTDEIEQRLSPQRHVDKLMAPLLVVYGTGESAELQRQSREFAAAAKAAGKEVSLAVMEGYNHFEVLEQFANPLGAFGRAVLRQMKLAPG